MDPIHGLSWSFTRKSSSSKKKSLYALSEIITNIDLKIPIQEPMNNYVSYIDLPDAGQQYLRSINKTRAYGIIEEYKTHGIGLEEAQRLIYPCTYKVSAK